MGKGVVEVTDEVLLGFVAFSEADAFADIFIERCQALGFAVHRRRVELVYDSLQGLANGVAVQESGVGKEGLEDRQGEDVLREHFHHIVAADGGVERVLQALQEVGEVFGKLRAAVDQRLDTGG